jgi:hypothetical protein
MSERTPIRGPLVVAAIVAMLVGVRVITFPSLIGDWLIDPTIAALTTMMLVMLWQRRGRRSA